jgi:hypothetical protein
MDLQIKEYAKAHEKNMKEIRALNAAVSAHLARPPSPPPLPIHIPPDFVIQSVEATLLDSARATVQPLVDDVLKHVEETLHAQHTELYDTLWAKLDLTLQMVEAISERIGGVDLPLNKP